MSLTSSMNNAVSALHAQSSALATVSGNLANSSTVGYKAASTSFSSLLANTDSSSGYTSGGVSAYSFQNLAIQGDLQENSSETSLAIKGNGYFPVTQGPEGEETFYTRDGEFSIDDDGYLVNGEYNLAGWTTDSDGNVTSANTNSVDALEPINVKEYSSTSSPTTAIDLRANLPADAEIGDTFTTSFDVVDALGGAQTVPVTWEKTAANTWTMTLNNPTDSATGAASGVIGGSTTYTLTFDGEGALAGIEDDTATAVDDITITIDSWNSGADTATYGDISLNIGEVGSLSGLTQKISGETEPQVKIGSISQNGVEYGTLSGVQVGDDGTVIAQYSNGQELPIYKIPVVTFGAQNGLEQNLGGVYEQTPDSGSYTLHVAGTGGSGAIRNYFLEASTTNTTEELSTMITAQQAYSAASQVITSTKEMFDALIQATR